MKHLVIYHFLGRGILKDGFQCFVLNEYDEVNKTYKLLPAEQQIRTFAEKHPNSYNIAIFDCTRMLQIGSKTELIANPVKK